MKHFVTGVALGLGILTASVFAQSGDTMTNGEVRRINKDSGRITLKHEEIKNLDMPPMTMVFRVADPSMLDKVKVGDKVRFAAEDRKGALTLRSIEPLR